MYTKTQFLKTLELSYTNYVNYGARSPEKIKPLHHQIAINLKKIWGDAYTIDYLGENLKEKSVEGQYYDKRIDITINDKNKPIFCLGVKFVVSNYKQNALNYFENMMGETANIQANNNIPYAQIIILRHQTPYLNKQGEVKKIEIIKDVDIKKYLRLFFDIHHAHRPRYFGIAIIDINEDSHKVTFTDIKNNFSREMTNLLMNKVSLSTFFEDISDYKDYYLLSK